MSNQDEPIFQNVTSAQRSTKISNNTYKPRTYKENWYAEEQYVSWTRQQRLIRDLECKDIKTSETKIEKRLRVLMDMQINWRLVVCDVEKWTGEDVSEKYPEYIQACWEDYYGGCMARRQRKQLQEELSELEFPRLRAKHRKGLMYDWETDETAKQINSKRKKVTTMHPYVGLADKDTLEVGDYMRVSTNQYYKFKWASGTNEYLGVWWCEPTTTDPNATSRSYWNAEHWARHVRQYHPKYKDAKTRAEINAKRIADIKKAHPDLDYF